MNKKKKILAVIACFTVIAGSFCIRSFAYDTDYENNTITFTEATDITFDQVIPQFSSSSDVNVNYSVQSVSSNCNIIRYTYSEPKLSYMYPTGSMIAYRSGTWNAPRTITIKANQTITFAEANFLSSISDLPAIPDPPPPPPLPEVVNNVQETFSFTLTTGSLIISWLIANQIALAGLYLYILISLIAVMKRFFVT